MINFYRKPVGRIAINMKPVSGPWGGSSVFVWQFSDALKRHGFKVQYTLKGDIDVIILIDPRPDLQSGAFSLDEIRAYRLLHPGVKILHRINECDKRKNSNFIDDLIEDANAIADSTIFISEWLRDHFVAKWYDPKRHHKVIYNGADPTIFHPISGSVYDRGGSFRIVTHHWSDNPMKGFPSYKLLDDMIADAELDNVELWVIGRWPDDLKWRSAKTFSPAAGHRLASQLRQCHAYITASLWEPCGMHHVEGAQCGLPMLYHEDGGGIVEAGKRYGIGFRENTLWAAVEYMRANYEEMRRKVFQSMPDGIRMAEDFVREVKMLMAGIR